jgi:hypothetical protein
VAVAAAGWWGCCHGRYSYGSYCFQLLKHCDLPLPLAAGAGRAAGEAGGRDDELLNIGAVCPCREVPASLSAQGTTWGALRGTHSRGGMALVVPLSKLDLAQRVAAQVVPGAQCSSIDSPLPSPPPRCMPTENQGGPLPNRNSLGKSLALFWVQR